MVHLYLLLMAPLSLMAAPILLLFPRGRRRFGERYGGWGGLGGEFVWFHGASVGEVRGLLPIMRRCRAEAPGVKILCTAASPTGLDVAAEVADVVRLLPLDHPWWIRRAIRSLNIRAFVFGETELWPALILELHRRGIPQVLVNGRVSAYSIRWYRALRPLLRTLLERLEVIFAGSEGDAERFRQIGAPADRVRVAGNAKYDLAPSVPPERIEAIRREYFVRPLPVLVLGSLRPGEEEVWFRSLSGELRARMNVVIAPRHEERFDYFAARLREFDIPFQRRSAGAPAAQVLLLDTYGELERVYAIARAAFIGGTIVDWGGHNPVEAAAYGVAIAAGEYTGNIEDVVEALTGADAFIPLRDSGAARALAERVAGEDRALVAMGERARAAVAPFIGASERIMQAVGPLMSRAQGVVR